eukprot:GHVL01007370.1.p1 GENE.GHVL01007370.1~~GHVL01007370.1.p1  ORF type:complete len:286 (+),score=39.53 GHVL01007370.1:38-895(+)
MEEVLKAYLCISTQERITGIARAVEEHCKKLLSCEGCVVFVYDLDLNCLVQLQTGPFRRQGSSLQCPSDSACFTNKLFKHEGVYRSKDINNDSLYSPEKDSQLSSLSVKSIISNTLFRPPRTVGCSCNEEKGPAFGLLCAYNGDFQEAEESIFKMLSDSVSVGLHNTQLIGEVVLAKDRAEGLTLLLSSLDDKLCIQSAALTLSTHAKQLVQANHCRVFLYEAKTNQICSIASDTGTAKRVPVGKGVIGKCVETGSIINIADVSKDPLHQDDPILQVSPGGVMVL